MFEVNNIGNTLTLKITENRLDANSAASFKNRMADIIKQGHSVLILNLENIKFIDSSGLGAIVSSLKAMRGEGDLIICNACPVVMDLFRLTRMDKVLKIFDSEGEALKSLQHQ